MKILVTIGDINGIGLEVFSKALISGKIPLEGVEFTLIGNRHSISDYLTAINTNFKIENDLIFINDIAINLIDTTYQAQVEFGEIAESAGLMAVESLLIAGEKINSKQYDAILTLPIAKKAMHLATWNFPGHTEYFANLCNVVNPLMILCNDEMRVALATIHLPITKVSDSITIDLLVDLVSKFNDSLQTDYQINNPRIAILGLNPHAGEDGDIGNEEISKIIPAIELIKAKGINVNGPIAADGFYAHGDYKNYSGIFAMYHDQGLIPLKLLSHGGGVNFTAGLPIIRTSPDHGTAFSLAGKNIANAQSTIDAINLAISITNKRRLASNLHI